VQNLDLALNRNARGDRLSPQMSDAPLSFGIDRSFLRLESRDPYLCLHFVMLFVRDQERSLRFYEKPMCRRCGPTPPIPAVREPTPLREYRRQRLCDILFRGVRRQEQPSDLCKLRASSRTFAAWFRFLRAALVDGDRSATTSYSTWSSETSIIYETWALTELRASQSCSISRTQSCTIADPDLKCRPLL
jgi:hypothetical protein